MKKPEPEDYGDKVADIIDEEVNKIIRSAYRKAERILTENKATLKRIAEVLISRETLEGEELEALFSEPVTAEATEAATEIPAPAPAKAKTRAKPVSRKAPGISQLFPKPGQAPSSP